MSTADALVVGAGPAGSIAALVLARAGVRVRLIDRARFPRFKLCGDTLNPGALATLRSADEAAWRRVLAMSLPIAGMTVTGPGGAHVTADYPAGIRGMAIPRSDLDLVLLEAALAAGVEFEEGVRVAGPVVDEGQEGPPKGGHYVRSESYVVSGFSRTSPEPYVGSAFRRTYPKVTGVRVAAGKGERTINARVVIAADGRGSRLGSALQISRFARRPRRWAFGAYYSGVTGLTARGEMHIQPHGYLGIAPLPGGAANVCVVRELPSPGSRGADGAAHGIDAATIIDRAIAAAPPLRDRFRHAERCTPVTSLGPLALESDAAGVPGMLLAGDAAGFVDPMTGDGLRFALAGGLLAARAALDELATGEPAFAALGAARTGEFAAKWRLNRGLRALVGSPRGVACAARLTTLWDAPIRYLVAAAGDVRLAAGQPALVAPTALTHPVRRNGAEA